MITKNDVTIILPSLGHKEALAIALEQITHRPLLVVYETGRRELDVPDDLRGATLIERPQGLGCPQAYEWALQFVKTSHVLGMSDDCRVLPKDRDRWMDEAIAAHNEHLGDKDGVLALNSGTAFRWEFLLNSKKFYMEHLFPVPYLCHWSDSETIEKARRLGVFAEAPRACVQHDHKGAMNNPKIEAAEFAIYQRRLNQFVKKYQDKVTPKVFVALPIYWNIDPFFFQSVLKFMREWSCSMSIDAQIGDSAIGRSRNVLTRKFLESDCTHILFIDSDLVFSAAHVTRILYHKEDVVGGFYPKKQEGPLSMVCNTLDEVGMFQAREDGLIEVKYIGTGFLRVSRRAFELMIQHYGPQIKYTVDGDPNKSEEYDFWHMGTYQYKDGSRRYLSEDWWFCQRWIDLGGKIWGDGQVLLKHSGSALYPLRTQEQELFRKEQIKEVAELAKVT